MKTMKQLLKYKNSWFFSLVTTLITLNLGTQGGTRPLPFTKAVLLAQQINSSPNPTMSAREIIRNAYKNRYTWNPQFPGYTAAVEFKQGKEVYMGHARVTPGLNLTVTGIENKEAFQAVKNTLGMIIVHHRQVPFEEEHKNSIFRLGSTDATGAVNIFEQGDKTEAHYKIFHNQFMQVNRTLGDTAVTVDVLNSQETPQGYLATHYRTIFYQPQTKQAMGEEESEDTYKKIGNYYILSRRVNHEYEQGQNTTSEIDFTNIQLLKNMSG